MGDFNITNQGTPGAAATGYTVVFPHDADLRIKQIDSFGVLSSLVDDGWHSKNFIINGGFDFAQRQAPGTLTTYSNTTGRTYGADMWGMTNENASMQYQRVDTGSAPETLLAAQFYGKFKKLTTAGKMVISQVIEDGEAMSIRGRYVRFQCKMKYSVASSMTVRLGLIQNNSSATSDVIAATFISAFGAASTDPTLGTNLAYITPTIVENTGTLSGNAATCVLTAGWVRYSAIFLVPSNSKNLIPCIWTNGQPAANDELNISEAGLYDGQELRDWVAFPAAQETSRCQRWYCKTFPIETAPVQNGGVAGAIRGMVAIAGAVTTSSCMQFKFPGSMRLAPTTITFYNPSAANAFMRNIPAATDATATAAASATTDGVDINCTGLAAWTVGQELKVHATFDASI